MIEIPKHLLYLSSEMIIAARAASFAGTVIRQGFARRWQTIQEKGLGDLVCQVDVEAQRVIINEIRTSGNDDLIISEELPSPQGTLAQRCWVVDPLDATSAFVFRSGEHFPSILIAFRQSGVMEIAVALFPLMHEWFYSLRGGGTYKNGRRLYDRAGIKILNEAWVDLNQQSDAEYETPEFALLRQRLRSRIGARLVTSYVPHSGIAARIAEGEQLISAVIHDNNPRKVKQAPWDVCAPQLILEEAGGVFLNLRGERYDPFNPQPILAANSREIADQILALLEV
jgi:fructose-1,6-bisphosphatase/inositol monophosphatase family enzyme